MANNRMYLVHLPTGLAIPLGKRMGWGWSLAGDYRHTGISVSRLFEVLDNQYSYEGNQDDFAVALEDADRATLATGQWQYGPPRIDGLVQLVMTKTVEPQTPIKEQ